MPSRPTPHLERPSPKLAAIHIRRYDSDRKASGADRALATLFEHFPQNTRPEEVLVKVVALNGLYRTNVFHVVDVAAHIVGVRPDHELSKGSAALVDAIAGVEINGKPIRYYSFATKYCNWHRPDAYPIYDSFVEKVLWAYQSQYPFAAFKRADLQKEYSVFKGIVQGFRIQFGLTHLSFKELDKFLWFYGRAKFG